MIHAGNFYKFYSQQYIYILPSNETNVLVDPIFRKKKKPLVSTHGASDFLGSFIFIVLGGGDDCLSYNFSWTACPAQRSATYSHLIGHLSGNIYPTSFMVHVRAYLRLRPSMCRVLCRSHFPLLVFIREN